MKSRIRHTIIASVFFFLLLHVGLAHAQEVLTLPEVLNIVRKFHPIARQADLLTEEAKANRQAARGGFDPALYLHHEKKTFDGKNYFFYTNPELKIPTWYGIELKAGIENNGGERLNPEVTEGKSSYSGISIPLAKNLLLDSRRAVLQQANLLVQQNEAERRNAYNNLLFDATIAYWQWALHYQVLMIISNTVEVNRQRINLVRQTYEGGERAAIDTVEAIVQLQQFMLAQSEAQLRFINSSLALSNFLWLQNEQPYRLPINIIPDTTWRFQDVRTLPLPMLEETLGMALANHPKLAAIGLKRDALEVERRLKFQGLLPTLNVEYNFLNDGYRFYKGIGVGLLENNYKYGISFGMPLLLRQARGEYKLAKIKIEQTDLDRRLALLEIENKVKSYYNELLALQQQVQLFEEMYSNYLRLLLAEETRFAMGESSLFILNSREVKLLETLQKLLELKAKYYQTATGLQWAAGRL